MSDPIGNSDSQKADFLVAESTIWALCPAKLHVSSLIRLFTGCMEKKKKLRSVEHKVKIDQTRGIPGFSGCKFSCYAACHKKTCLPGFRPGPTQTGLCSHRRWLEA